MPHYLQRYKQSLSQPFRLYRWGMVLVCKTAKLCDDWKKAAGGCAQRTAANGKIFPWDTRSPLQQSLVEKIIVYTINLKYECQNKLSNEMVIECIYVFNGAKQLISFFTTESCSSINPSPLMLSRKLEEVSYKCEASYPMNYVTQFCSFERKQPNLVFRMSCIRPKHQKHNLALGYRWEYTTSVSGGKWYEDPCDISQSNSEYCMKGVPWPIFLFWISFNVIDW